MDSLREMNQKQTSLGVALSGVQAEVGSINLILTFTSRLSYNIDVEQMK